MKASKAPVRADAVAQDVPEKGAAPAAAAPAPAPKYKPRRRAKATSAFLSLECVA